MTKLWGLSTVLSVWLSIYGHLHWGWIFLFAALWFASSILQMAKEASDERGRVDAIKQVLTNNAIMSTKSDAIH